MRGIPNENKTNRWCVHLSHIGLRIRADHALSPDVDVLQFAEGDNHHLYDSRSADSDTHHL